ncbi:MAG: HAD-IIA family hydrolase [Candidatus Nanohalobium sp.]
MRPKEELQDVKNFFFDVEKTLLNWDTTVLGAEDLIYSLRESGKNVFFHTDTSVFSRKQYASRLTDSGLEASPEEVLTSGTVAAKSLAEKDIGKAYVIGEEGLINELESEDIDFSKDAETVVVGLDRQFNYSKLRRAKKILDEGGDMYFCSTDQVLRRSTSTVPHQAALNEALKVFGEGEVIGKPSQEFKKVFKGYFSYFPSNSLFVGDRFADIEMGNRLGMKTAGVLTGEISEEALKEADDLEKPDFMISSLPKLRKAVL